jgi:hypothetical protein
VSTPDSRLAAAIRRAEIARAAFDRRSATDKKIDDRLAVTVTPVIVTVNSPKPPRGVPGKLIPRRELPAPKPPVRAATTLPGRPWNAPDRDGLRFEMTVSDYLALCAKRSRR